MPSSTVVSLHSAPDGTGRRGIVDRDDYLIDRFRVRYEFGGGWKCVCAEFVGSDACKHTREAAGRRAAQARILQHVERGSAEAFGFNEPKAPVRGSPGRQGGRNDPNRRDILAKVLPKGQR